jgi:hypothetical protein
MRLLLDCTGMGWSPRYLSRWGQSLYSRNSGAITQTNGHNMTWDSRAYSPESTSTIGQRISRPSAPILRPIPPHSRIAHDRTIHRHSSGHASAADPPTRRDRASAPRAPSTRTTAGQPAAYQGGALNPIHALSWLTSLARFLILQPWLRPRYRASGLYVVPRKWRSRSHRD